MPPVECAHDCRRRKREERAPGRKRRDHVQHTHEKDPVQPREGKEAQAAYGREAYTGLRRTSRPSVCSEISGSECLQKRCLEEAHYQHGDDSHNKERRQMCPWVKAEKTALDVRPSHSVYAIFALRTCLFRNLDPMRPPTIVPAANSAIIRRIQGSSVYWAIIAVMSAAL